MSTSIFQFDSKKQQSCRHMNYHNNAYVFYDDDGQIFFIIKQNVQRIKCCGLRLHDSTALGWYIDNPCINHTNCSLERVWVFASERYHWNSPLSSLLYNGRRLSSSQSKPLIRSLLFPQKRNRLPSYGRPVFYAACITLIESIRSIISRKKSLT